MTLVLIKSSQFPSLITTLLDIPTKYFYAAEWAGRDLRRTAVGGYKGVAGTCVTSELCVCTSENDKNWLEIEYTESIRYLFQSFLAVFLRRRDEFTGGDRGRWASRLRRGRLWLQLGGNYEIQTHETDVTKYNSWGWCANRIPSCFCFDETETITVHKETDYVTTLKCHLNRTDCSQQPPCYISDEKHLFCILQQHHWYLFSTALNLHMTLRHSVLISSKIKLYRVLPLRCKPRLFAWQFLTRA